jgi:hypothetical protein
MANMHVAVVNERHELVAQLISKQDARSNNNDGTIRLSKQLQCVLNHDDSFAATSGNNHLTLVSGLHCIESTLLVGTEGDGHQWGSNTL